MRSDKTLMKHKGYFARIMEADRLRGDQVFGLPPGRALTVYHSEEFVNYPESWMKGPGVFVVPVKADKGLWFDWTQNDASNTAVLPTVKGCNPITGLQTSGFHLERYSNKCPKHGCDFQGDRYCPECDYKWPPNNYVSEPNVLWWDGFRSEDGHVRQFFFTEEEMRDVATHMIGKENTVPAFGFAFYKPKELRPTKQPLYRGPGIYEIKGTYFGSSSSFSNLLGDGTSWSQSKGGSGVTYTCDSFKGMSKSKKTLRSSGDGAFEVKTSGGIISSQGLTQQKLTTDGPICAYNMSADMNGLMEKDYSLCSDSDAPIAMAALPVAGAPVDESYEERCSDSIEEQPDLRTRLDMYKRSKKAVKEVSVGAGAKIEQNLSEDPYALDSWCDKPESVMTIYFVFQEKFDELKAGGMKSLEGKEEGMLAGVPVG